MRSGIVLIELLIAMVLAAMLGAIAVPRLVAAADAAAVRDEILRAVAAFDAARGAAVRLGAVASLTLSDTSYRVTAIVGVDTILAWRQVGPARNGVTVGGTGAAIGFSPDGLALGVANRTITLSRGSVSRRVVMSKYGRLTY